MLLGLLGLVALTARLRRRRWLHSVSTFVAVLIFAGGCQMPFGGSTSRYSVVPNQNPTEEFFLGGGTTELPSGELLVAQQQVVK